MSEERRNLWDKPNQETEEIRETGKEPAAGGKRNDTRATALVSMTKDNKQRLTGKAKEHGLSLSSFFRLAADEYIRNHNW